MPALLMTAAEIAAAEALAAEILVAQQAAAATAAAAAEAVQVANAAQAAQVAQAAQAAQTGQAAQTLSAAQAGGYGGVNSVGTAQAAQATQTSASGLQALTQEVVGTVQPTGLETLNVAQAPLQATTPAAEMEKIRQMASGAENMARQPVNFLNNSVASAGSSPIPSASPTVQPVPQSTSPLYGSSTQLPTYGTEAVGPNLYPDITAPVSNASAPQTMLDKYSVRNTYMDGAQGMDPLGAKATSLQTTQPAFTDVGSTAIDGGVRPGFNLTSQYVEPSAASSNLPAQPATGLQGLLDKGIAYAEKNPLLVGMGAMSVYNMLNQPKPYEKPKYKSTFNASTYRGYEPTPPTPYTPQYAQYAQGGLADLGGYSDYARGGRMLKGPGDGMSDDIPATIANKQPARLANEEFVVPADVVSHLGNGSSEAGAKALYKMMDRVRQARTGNKKQGKQINPEKYLA